MTNGKKVGILTFCGPNCGNRLQNYAMQTALQQLGYQAETIRRQEGSMLREALRYWVKPLLEHDRFSRFHEFNRHIRWSRQIVSPGYTTENLQAHYDHFVIGSDQIWNPDFPFVTDLDYLPMVPPEKKSAYAASFGISSIPEEKQAHTAQLLNDIPRIMVREDSGAKIVRDLTGREAAVVLDPTLLLTDSQWETVMRKPRNLPKEPYGFVYLLGDSDPDEKAKQFFQEQNLKCVDFYDDDMMAGPAEFLYLIRHADMICTDSFHACVFSFLFRRPLVIFDRISRDADMSSRLDTLCQTFELSAHRVRSDDFSLDAVCADPYEAGHQTLVRERQRCTQLLQQAVARTETVDVPGSTAL